MSELQKIRVKDKIYSIMIKSITAVPSTIIRGSCYNSLLEVIYSGCRINIQEDDTINIFSCGVKGKVIKKEEGEVYSALYLS